MVVLRSEPIPHYRLQRFLTRGNIVNGKWHLDVTFREDACRARKDYSATNLNTLRKFALAIVSQYKDKLSLRKRLFKAALNMDYLKKLLKI